MSGLDAFFESYYRLRPVNATFTGVHACDDRLPDWSPDGLAAAADEMRTLGASLLGGRPPADAGTQARSLDDTAARDRELAIAFLDVQIAEHDGPHFQRRNPSLAIGELAFGIIGLITAPFSVAAERAASLLGRLDAAPRFLRGARRSIAGGIPAEWRTRAERECDGVEVLLSRGLPMWCAAESLPSGIAGKLDAAAADARAALAEHRVWLSRVEPAPDGAYACGAGMFDLLLERGHWCGQKRADLLAGASDALDEALAAVERRARGVGATGWPEIQERLSAAHPSAAEYLSAYQRVWDASRRRADELRLVTWPDAPIQYVPIPPHTRDAAPSLYYLHYRSPAPFDRLPVHDYVVTPIEPGMDQAEQARRLRATNDSVIKLNHVVHHGGIGHHVQNHHAYRGGSEIGRIAAVDCASRIGMFLAGTMAEGWACYATDLMDECGFLTPDESIAQQHTRARLLARAVADIRLHEGSWTLDQAAALYRDRIGMADGAARAEACKNSMFPGTAIMYWLGTDGLHQLRRHRERAEGGAFSLVAFHDRVLSYGSIPVPLVTRILR